MNRAIVELNLTYGGVTRDRSVELTIRRAESDQRDQSTSVTFNTVAAIRDVIEQIEEVKQILLSQGIYSNAPDASVFDPDGVRLRQAPVTGRAPDDRSTDGDVINATGEDSDE